LVKKETMMGSGSDATSLHVDIDGDNAVVRVPAALFATPGGDSADQRLLGLVHELDRPRLLLDFDAVDYLNSMGLATLLTVHKHVRASGGRLAVVNVRPHVYEIFAVTRLTTVLNVCEKAAA
jgi:stage II sporulation protein AA (anti-sigma F factor antagonist)